jgi:hypothetical protein
MEGAINDVGESHLGTWAWERLEKVDTSLKWFVLSKFISGQSFLPDCEPLSTVNELAKIRNKLAHPKKFQIAKDVIIRHADGTLREIPLDQNTRPPGVSSIAQDDILTEELERVL